MKKFFIQFAFFLQALTCSGQMPVSKEPMHHNVFENSFVRILDVHLLPKDTSLFHKHETPSVFIVLTAAKTGSEVTMEEVKATALRGDATISFEGFYITPRVHRVWNEDTSEFHVMDVEILNKKPQKMGSPLQQKDFKLLFDEIPVRAYRLTTPRGRNIKLRTESPYLVIGLSDGTGNAIVNKKLFHKKGDFVFIPAGRFMEITNKEEPYSFAVLEFK
jgi:hypothetical protein